METYLNNLTERDGEIKALTTIRPGDNKMYFCDKKANMNIDILTVFYSPIDIKFEIIFSQNVVDVQPTNEYCGFIQHCKAGCRTMPVCGPLILCASSFSCVCARSEYNLENLQCYGVQLEATEHRYLIRNTILSCYTDNSILEYKNGFVIGYRKEGNVSQKYVIIEESNINE